MAPLPEVQGDRLHLAAPRARDPARSAHVSEVLRAPESGEAEAMTPSVALLLAYLIFAAGIIVGLCLARPDPLRRAQLERERRDFEESWALADVRR